MSTGTLRRMQINLAYCASSVTTVLLLEWAVEKDLGYACFLAAIWLVALTAALFANSSSFGLSEKVRAAVAEDNISFQALVRRVVASGLLFTLVAYLFFWLWAADFSFVSDRGSRLWEQTIFISLVIIVEWAGFWIAVTGFLKRRNDGTTKPS